MTKFRNVNGLGCQRCNLGYWGNPLLQNSILQLNYLYKNCSEFYFAALSAMMGCSETRKACWCRAELAGPAWLAWLRVIGERAVNPVTAEAQTHWPHSGHCLQFCWLKPQLTVTITSTPEQSAQQSDLCLLSPPAVISLHNSQWQCDVCYLRVMGSGAS